MRDYPSRWKAALAPAAVAAALLALAACGSDGGQRCTAIGSPRGVSLDIRAPDAARVESASLKVCWNGTCRDPELELSPSSTTVPLGCDGDEPESACAASASPDGGKHGFANVEGLPKTPVQVTLKLRDARGRTVTARRVDLTPKATFPNGRHCGEGAPQAGLVVANGAVTVR